MLRPTRQVTRKLANLLVAALLLVNTSAVWAQFTDDLQGNTEISVKSCHTEQASAQDIESAGHGCCDDATLGCAAGCKCPAMASAVLFDNRLFIAVMERTQIFALPQAMPIQSDPSLFLQPPRQAS